MKVIIAIIMGFFSGFLFYMMTGLVFYNNQEPSSLFIFVTFCGGWAASIYIMLRGVKTISKVVSRGFLIGAAEWFSMILVGLIFAGKTVSETVNDAGVTDAAVAGAAIGGGIIAFLTGGVSIFMTIVCLIGFAIAYSIGREMKPEANTPTMKCPECAELIQAEARKCRFCGASPVSNDLPST